MKNTATVLVERTAKHPLYKKTFVQTKKYLADVSINIKEGDMVEIVKVRPVSKNKHWKVTKVVGKDLGEITEEILKAEAEKLVAEVMPEEKETEESSVVSPQIKEETGEKQKKPKKRKESLKADS